MNPGQAIVGRDGEREKLSAFLAAPQGQALVLRGETGVGKSALLDHAAALATPAHDVIRAAGVEAESELPYAGLHQLLHPLLPRLSGLDDGHRAAFDVAFGLRQGGTPSVMSLGIAVLDLLSLASSGGPLLLLLDDGQWLDASSIEVCGFVGRRLAGSAVKMLIAVRSDVGSRFDTAALPELTLPPLPDEAAGRLLDLRHPGLSPRTRRLVLEHAMGNALALVELPPYVEAAGFGSVPLSRRLQHVYGLRIERLAAPVREELLRGALDGVGAGQGGNRSPGRRYRMRDTGEAMAAGLLDTDPATGELVFRHPLVRSTVVQLSTPNQRRAAHADLARLHEGEVERHARHLAASRVDPDEEVAATLEAAAESATRRGGAVAAVAWLTRAAELSETPADRSRRLGDAAFIAGHAALLDQAQRLVRSDPAPGPAESPATAIAAAYVALYEDGDVRSAHHRVAAAIEHLGDDGPEVLTRLVDLLLAISQYAGDAGSWHRTEELLRALGDRVHPRSAVYRDAWSDVVRHGGGVDERVERAFADVSALEPWDVSRLAVAAYHVDTLSRYRPHLQRAVDREVETGAVANGMTMLHLIMLDQLAAGEWDDAERTGRRALELNTAHGNVLFAHHTRAYLGLLAAVRGRLERARELQAVVDAWARPRGVGFLTQLADAIGTAAALSEGDYEAAYLHAIGITPPGSFEPYAHQAARTLLDLVESAVHTGRLEQAHRHSLAALDAGLPGISPRLALITYSAAAMTTGDEKEAADLYARAEAAPGAAGFPFELARIRLARGVRLRHTQGPRAARPLLVLAAESFDRLGAVGWAERAQAELRASGAPAGTAPSHLTELTWQERRIAELAAGGLTNKEIGERMRLSPRTVSSHLYRVFPKLGITSRAALRDALGKLPG
ncbi:helix-turn-helix transcriptional regulator [Nonomuraea rubra]|uniref:DNA-binding CsgD family transcriptional regulator/energy-coupling factor transporter ATP-binding protein EcfA2 n=2 Tax=Nonomuraea rubra TaxID=46180 RepID=A0A7X0NPT1_9ACTN|nr:LuxR C-terminal-related transcriptional regulator [Nonomuraea rubra]MBB6547342.1 DNA-binding CsgD family transcriptional regulator/energy-coupling factor transporter ATP-binding protein EcfA2 [Nonomuraea rubra]